MDQAYSWAPAIATIIAWQRAYGFAHTIQYYIYFLNKWGPCDFCQLHLSYLEAIMKLPAQVRRSTPQDLKAYTEGYRTQGLAPKGTQFIEVVTDPTLRGLELLSYVDRSRGCSIQWETLMTQYLPYYLAIAIGVKFGEEGKIPDEFCVSQLSFTGSWQTLSDPQPPNIMGRNDAPHPGSDAGTDFGDLESYSSSEGIFTPPGTTLAESLSKINLG